MTLRIRRINQVGILVALCAAALAVVGSIVAGLPWWAWLIAGGVMYGTMYWIARTFMRQYAINRIKPVYQLLYSRDINTSRLSEALRRRANDDIVDDIQESLEHLVSLSENEIERLVQKERERTEFLESVAHEIKSPVANIKGYTQALLEDEQDPEMNRKHVERIVRSADRLTAIVDDIERLAKYESGGVTLYKEDFDIVELIYEVFDTNILHTREKKIKLKLDKHDYPARGEVLVYADRLRINQALDRLVDNGIKYGKEGGAVTVSLLDGFENIAVEVTDDGIGIPPQDLPYLFQKMHRIKKGRSRTQRGAGLSLVGVKRIVDAHGEHITVRSEVGRGTTFTVTLAKSGLKEHSIQ